MTTPLKPGDVVVGPCDPVGNLPPKQLALVGGRLVEIPGTGVTARGKLFLASRKAAIMANFAAQGLAICDDATHHFAKAETLLRLNLGPAGTSGIYVWGRNNAGDAFVALAFQLDATPNTVFGGGRVILPAIAVGGTIAVSLAAGGQRDGSLLASGYLSDTGAKFIARFLPGGTLDPAFGVAGILSLTITEDVGGLSQEAPDNINVIPGGRNIAYGDYTDLDGRFHFVTIDGSGNPISDALMVLGDPIWGLFQNVLPYSLVGLASGKFAVVEVNSFGLDPAMWLGVFDAAGGLQQTTTVPAGFCSPNNTPAFLATDGKILLASITSGGDIALRRYDEGGVLDFDVTIPAPSPLDTFGTLEAVAAGSDGKIMVAALDQYTSVLMLCRLNSDGTIDSTFGTSGVVTGTVDLTDVVLNVNFSYGLAIALP